MSPLHRTLNFFYDPCKMTKNTNVIFTFVPPTSDPLSDVQNRAAWKVFPIKIEEDQTGKFTVDFEAHFGFSTAQIGSSTLRFDPGGIIRPELIIAMKLNESTTLQPNGLWSKPTYFGGGDLQAINQTDLYQNIVVGTVIKKGPYFDLKPTFLFHVGSGSAVIANFHSTLLMYVTTDYQQNSLMTSDQSTDLYWQQDLSALQEENSDWSFVELPNGKYEVTPIIEEKRQQVSRKFFSRSLLDLAWDQTQESGVTVDEVINYVHQAPQQAVTIFQPSEPPGVWMNLL
ncbi:hypothetical protein L218DRAFT_1006934 [Marasmius fiardii PR-910]|nr:hypothetical protein L218DRAFT_1006934 [Marasmius fiardii PR-910]